MENVPQNLQKQPYRCATKRCSHDAFNYCMTHSAKIWTTCSVVLHYNCYIDIKKEKEFVDTSFKILNNLINAFKKEGEECFYSSILSSFDKTINILKTKYFNDYTKYIKDNENHNLKSWIKSWIEQIRLFFTNQAYSKIYSQINWVVGLFIYNSVKYW